MQTIAMMAPRILVAEDDDASREGLRSVLALWGYEAETTADGQGALERAIALRPALIISDLAMPRMDGLALLRAVRAVLPETPIIVVTGDGSGEGRAHAAKEGAVDCLMKPVDLYRLKGLIARTLGIVGARQP